MIKPVIIIGANPIGKIVLEIFTNNGVVVFGFLDDDKKLHQKQIDDITILGHPDDQEYLKLLGKDSDVFVATDDVKLHKSLVKMLNDRHKVQPINALHSSLNMASNATIGHGNLLDAGVVVGAFTEIGNHTNIFSNASIGAETKLGDFVQIGMGSNIGHGVTIGNDVFIGAGVTIIAGITIGDGARIGAGSVVIASVKKGETVFGNPAAVVKN